MTSEDQMRTDCAAAAREALALPVKATCTVSEAAEAIGVSERQVRYWVADGTLLAINSAREPIAAEGRSTTERDRWRIVVRRPPDIPAKTGATFLTLEELVAKSLNINAG